MSRTGYADVLLGLSVYRHNLYPVFSLFTELLHYLRQHMCYLLSNAFSLNVDKYIA